MSDNASAAQGGEWIALSREQAEAHPLYGVEGWLRAVSVWLEIQIVLDFFRAGAFMLFTPDTALPGVVASTVSAFAAALALYHLLYLRPALPIWLAINAVVSMILLVFAAIAAAAAVFAVNVAILGYALLSKRVNISYRRRAKPEWLPRVIGVPEAAEEKADGAAQDVPDPR